MMYVQLVFCFCLTVVSANDNELDIGLGKPNETSAGASTIDGIMETFQATCLKDNPPQTVTELQANIQNILKEFSKYRKIVELEKKFKMEIQWTLKESRKNTELNKVIIPLLFRSVIDTCSKKPNVPKTMDCSDIMKYKNESGVYYIVIGQSHQRVKVYCDMDTDGGGWTVIQRRFNDSLNFKRTWAEYESGFGDVNGDFWLGNKFVHQFTTGARYKLRIVLSTLSTEYKYAEYKKFVVGDSASKYKLTIDGYTGDAGDGLKSSNGMKFTTFDQDNDLKSGSNCAVTNGAWWSKACSTSGLNNNKIVWNNHIFYTSEMAIRRI